MYKIDGKYGNIHIKGKTADIERSDIPELETYKEYLEKTERKLLKEQNNYLSEILK